MNSYELFLEQIELAVDKYPKLKIEIGDNGKSILRGEIDIIDSTGKYWESFRIEIHSTELFPKRFPKVFEIDGKIPPIGDWHIYEDTKSCCIKVLPEEIIACRKGITVTDFIHSEVLPYFFNQTHRRIEGYYVNGEYSHGSKGIYEFYSRQLRTTDPLIIFETIAFISKSEKPGRTHLCFCGSGEKFRKCHRESYDRLVLIDPESLMLHAFLIKEYFNRLN